METDMAKGQMRSTREKRKPKQEKKEKKLSAYQQSFNQRPGGNIMVQPPAKKEG
jgi:hypothetical protein